jgi:hypothetical protein
MKLVAFIALISFAFAMPADSSETNESSAKNGPKVETDGLAFEVASFVLATLDKYGLRDKQADAPSTEEPVLASSNSASTSEDAKDVSAVPTSSSSPKATKTGKKLKESDVPE